ncbi:MAG: hypothetical protein HRU17_18650 [Polyangiaceae bacterium]|nr:hypothetical protein [Polyangiaceae bacterium]
MKNNTEIRLNAETTQIINAFIDVGTNTTGELLRLGQTLLTSSATILGQVAHEIDTVVAKELKLRN